MPLALDIPEELRQEAESRIILRMPCRAEQHWIPGSIIPDSLPGEFPGHHKAALEKEEKDDSSH